MSACRPVGSALPPRRDHVAAAAASPSADWGGGINVQRARDRMLEFFEREQLPGDVKTTLAAALNGDLHYQHLLFTAMLDSWPKLQSNIAELAREVSIAPWKVHPHCERGEKPKPADEKFAKELEAMIWGMRPNAARMEDGFEDTISALAYGYYFGHAAQEVLWKKYPDGQWKPRATRRLPARFYGYPYDITPRGDDEDRLMLDPDGMTGSRNFVDFPEHRFLIAINRGHPSHPSTAAPLRALAPYWLAAVYGLKWLMNFTQLYGIPWRHAKVPKGQDKDVVAAALEKIGSKGYIITEPGAEISALQVAAANNTPQRDLIDLADKQCDVFILGQTLTSGTDDSGSRALGEVHEKTKQARIDAVADFVGKIFTYQLVPSVVAVNWGDREDLPQIWARREKAKDEKAKAERMEKLTRIGIPMSKAFVYEDLGVPVPAAGDELFEAAKPAEPEPPEPGARPGQPNPEDEPEKVKVEAAAAGEQTFTQPTVERLSAAVIEGLTGVSREWLSPVRPHFERLAALAMSRTVSDEDFIAALEKARRELPELFDVLDTEALQEAFADAFGTAMLAGSTARYDNPNLAEE